MGRVAKFFGRMFASPETTTQTLSMVRDGLDSMVLTQEEKVQYNQKSVELYFKFMELANSGPDIARRFIAILTSIIWGLAVTGSFFLVTVGIWVPGATQAGMALIDVSVKLVMPSWGAIMVFYFGKGILDNYLESKKQ